MPFPSSQLAGSRMKSRVCTHPVEVGTFGRFKHGGRRLVETWVALEDLCHDVEWWIGIYKAEDLLHWGTMRGLLTPEEVTMLEKAL